MKTKLVEDTLNFKKAQRTSKNQHTSKRQQSRREYLYRRHNISLELGYVCRARVALQPLPHTTQYGISVLTYWILSSV